MANKAKQAKKQAKKLAKIKKRRGKSSIGMQFLSAGRDLVFATDDLVIDRYGADNRVACCACAP
jgi:hypothetical protein